jgi:hypothetical protein
MKVFFLVLLSTLLISCGSGPPLPKSEPFSGVISANQLITQYPQFRAAYEQYQPSLAEINAVKLLSGKSLLILFGTWCHDSAREVPKLLKLIDLSTVELESLSLHGFNYNKQGPTNLQQQYDLKYLPTIILLQGEVELGRIVEKPILSLGKDLASFVTE